MSLTQRFGMAEPLSTHWRKATCDEVDCRAYTDGWETIVGADSEQADYIRHRSGRAYQETRTADGLARFRFAPEQRCFSSWQHRIKVGRPEIWTHTSALGERRVHKRGTDWMEHIHQEIDPVIDLAKREGVI